MSADIIQGLAERVAQALELRSKATSGPYTWGQQYICQKLNGGKYINIATTPTGKCAPEGSQWEIDAAFLSSAHKQADLIAALYAALQDSKKDARKAALEEAARISFKTAWALGSACSAGSAAAAIPQEIRAAMTPQAEGNTNEKN